MRNDNHELKQVSKKVPPAVADVRLVDLVAPYKPLSPSHFRPYPLTRDDVDAAFEGTADEDWSEQRARRMSLVCTPLEQLMSLGDDISGIRAINPVAHLAHDAMRAENCKLALHEADNRRDIHAIARFQRLCTLGRRQLDINYMLESLSVLPAHRNSGMERLLAAGLAALLVRELEELVDTLWHACTLSVQVRFTSRLTGPGSGALHGIVTSRLGDELIAQDSLLQLDGKLSRFRPLIVA